MWVLSALLAFIRLENFASEDASLLNTLVMSLSKSLAHQASLAASHTAFLTLKRRQFYLSHLPAYFSDVNKGSMLSSHAVCAGFLFSESDVSFALRHSDLVVLKISAGLGGRGLLQRWRSVSSRQSSAFPCSFFSV